MSSQRVTLAWITPVTTNTFWSLHSLAQGSGTTPDALLREAVEQLISQSQPGDWRTALHQARGMWKDRSDLPSLAELRGEPDRF